MSGKGSKWSRRRLDGRARRGGLTLAERALFARDAAQQAQSRYDLTPRDVALRLAAGSRWREYEAIAALHLGADNAPRP